MWNLHLGLLLLVGRTEERASSLTGSDLTLRTRGKATRGRLTGKTRGTGDTRPRYSNNLVREREQEESDVLERSEEHTSELQSR